ncbi:MAG: hypothetical protein JWP96_1864 [Polaromonas sp.]|nr:hypothetical protein [Polaromonas sp.]
MGFDPTFAEFLLKPILLSSPLLIAALIGTQLLTACGGDSETVALTVPPTPTTVTGVFLDSAVEGLDYTAGASAKASTNAKGEFICKDTETVVFSVGGIALGSAACGALITPLALAGTTNAAADRVVNRLLALQLLDEDGEPSNGIKLTAAVKTALNGRTLDFDMAPPAFNAALTALLALLPDPYKARAADDNRRLLAREHFEDTLASKTGAPAVQTVVQGSVSASITRRQVQAADSFYVPYEGSNAATKADFPKGFLPSYGSGLAFKARRADGTLEFYGLTDRGPNGDGPKVPAIAPATGTSDAKFFPSPSFAPAIGIITISPAGAVLQSSMPIRFSTTLKASGLSIAAGKVGHSGEVPLGDVAKYDPSKADFSDYGLDTEAIVVDAARGVLWVSDEYGPFILKIDPATGTVLKKYQPGTGAADLPEVLAKRRANRGMEGLALDSASGKLHGYLQSPLTDSLATATYAESYAGSTVCETDTGAKKRVERYARFTRWVEFDPTTETSKMYAYPLDCNDYAEGRTGNAKLGDLVSLGNGKFILIEQGTAPSGKVRNRLMLVEMGNATNIAAAAYNPATSDLEKSSLSGTAELGASYASVVAMKKTMLLDLNEAGWLAEKAEGLTLVDDSTLALINDNDFGLKTAVLDSKGVAISPADVTSCTVDAAGNFITNAAFAECTASNSMRSARGADTERPTRLWLIKFNKKLSEFAIP